MPYEAAGGRCAVDQSELPAPLKHSVAILEHLGFETMSVDVIALARSLVGTATYKRGSRLRDAPHQFDCSSLTKYLYALLGIWIPRRSIQQRSCGLAVDLPDLRLGDLVFCSGHIDYYDTDPSDGVGHVGIATGEASIIHAANARVGIVESTVESFLGAPEDFRGARRLIPNVSELITLKTPHEREVEISDDLRWIVLQQVSE